MKKNKAFTIIELLVAMGLFVIFMVIAGGGFIRALRTQKSIVALMAANDNASLTLEQMAREIRTGSNFSSPNSAELNFDNAYGESVVYQLKDNIIERNSKPVTASNVKINKLIFYLQGEDAGDGYPPRITISINISPNIPTIENINTNFQTTISSRNLDT